MHDFQIFFLPCHNDDALGAAAPDSRQLPSGARLFVEMQPALDALYADPVMMGNPSLLKLTMPGSTADTLSAENKLQVQSGGDWAVCAGAEEEFMSAQLWVRLLPQPQLQPATGERATLWAAFAREDKDASEGAWAFALRFCSGDKTACADTNFVVRVFAERQQALTALSKSGTVTENDDVALVALEVLTDKASFALGIVSRYRQGYVPAAHHLQTLVEHSICQLELLKPSDLPEAISISVS